MRIVGSVDVAVGRRCEGLLLRRCPYDAGLLIQFTTPSCAPCPGALGVLTACVHLQVQVAMQARRQLQLRPHAFELVGERLHITQ